MSPRTKFHVMDLSAVPPCLVLSTDDAADAALTMQRYSQVHGVTTALYEVVERAIMPRPLTLAARFDEVAALGSDPLDDDMEHEAADAQRVVDRRHTEKTRPVK